MKLSMLVSAAVAALAVGVPFASADDMEKRPDAPEMARAEGHLVFGDGAAKFVVQRDTTAGTMTFRLADPAVKLTSDPVIVMTTDAGPKEVRLVSVEPGVWRWSDPVVIKNERFDGSMRVVVGGQTYTSSLATVWTAPATDGWAAEPGAVKVMPRNGGRILPLTACGAAVEVVQDPATGSLTVYSTEDLVISEAPVITVTESKGPTTVTLTPVDGKDGVWVAKHESFKTTTTTANLRVQVNGKPCDVPLSSTTTTTSGATHGGTIVTVEGGPRFEVVRDPTAGYTTFYAVDETFDGRAYTIENPVVVVDGRNYPLQRVEGEPRAWRLVGLDNAGSDPRNAQLNFTLFGRTLSTRLGLDGLGIGAR
jgi:hypothetical protein